MKIIDKIIWSYEQPRLTNVLWFDATNNILKIYNAGAWLDITGSSTSSATPKAGIKCGDGTNMFNLLDAISIDSVYTPIIEECASNSFLSKFYNDGSIDIIITPDSANSCTVIAETKYFSIETTISIEEDDDLGENKVVVGEFSNNPEYEGFVEYYNSLVAKFEDSNDVTVPSISDLSTTFATVFGSELKDIYEVFSPESILAITEA